jgi:ATP-dependent Zn protease
MSLTTETTFEPTFVPTSLKGVENNNNGSKAVIDDTAMFFLILLSLLAVILIIWVVWIFYRRHSNGSTKGYLNDLFKFRGKKSSEIELYDEDVSSLNRMHSHSTY